MQPPAGAPESSSRARFGATADTVAPLGSIVSLLRIETARHPDDRDLVELVGQLSTRR